MIDIEHSLESLGDKSYPEKFTQDALNYFMESEGKKKFDERMEQEELSEKLELMQASFTGASADCNSNGVSKPCLINFKDYTEASFTERFGTCSRPEGSAFPFWCKCADTEEKKHNRLQ